SSYVLCRLVFFFQAEDGIRDRNVTGVQTCALPISRQPVIYPRMPSTWGVQQATPRSTVSSWIQTKTMWKSFYLWQITILKHPGCKIHKLAVRQLKTLQKLVGLGSRISLRGSMIVTSGSSCLL